MKKYIMTSAFIILAACASVKEFDPGEATAEQFAEDQQTCETFAKEKIQHSIGGYQIRDTRDGRDAWINHYNICMKSKGYKVKQSQ